VTGPSDTSVGLQAGAAHVDITPPAGVHLTGSIAEHRPAKLVWDPLYARAVVLQHGAVSVCILTLDVTLLTEAYTSRIRQAAAKKFGLNPDAVMVAATQTHSAPSLGRVMLDDDFPPLPDGCDWLGGGEQAYSTWAADRAVQAIGEAVDNLHPVQMGAGRGIEGRLAFNRRAVMRNGRVGMPGPAFPKPLGPTDILYIEGPIDPELGMVCLRDETMRAPIIIANYTCHPVHVFPRPIVSADWPGALANALTHDQPGARALVLNGACGDINPWPPFDPDYVEDYKAMGAMLARMAHKVIETLEFAPEGRLAYKVRRIPIPLREVPAEELSWARSILGESFEPKWRDEAHTAVDTDWMTAASIYSVYLMHQRSPVLDYEVQVLRVGDAAFVGLPGEPFVECGLQIKLASPARQTGIVHCTSQYVGYIPTRQALEKSGHEVDTRYWAKLAPEAFDMIVEAAGEVLGEVFCRRH